MPTSTYFFRLLSIVFTLAVGITTIFGIPHNAEAAAQACTPLTGINLGSGVNRFFTIDNAAPIFFGPSYSGYDFEALAKHPKTNTYYTIAGRDGTKDGNLYTLNPVSGALTLVGASATPWYEISSLSFHPDGTLWGFQKFNGLVTINTATNATTLVWKQSGIFYVEWDALAWNPTGTMLYGAQDNHLYKWDPAQKKATEICTNKLPKATQTLEYTPDGTLYGASGTYLFTINPDTCVVTQAPQSTAGLQSIRSLSPDVCLTPPPPPDPCLGNQSPIAAITPTTQTILLGETATFSAASSSDPENKPLTFAWNAPTLNINGSGDSFPITPSQTGTHSITLTTTDSCGAIASTTASLTVNPVPPPPPTPITGGAVTFTFDDARMGIYTNAAPVLATYNLTATYYGTTDYINDDYFKNMNWPEVLALKNQYNWDVDNHTTGHKNLTTLSDADARKQVGDAHQQFLDHGITPRTFAYPFGAYDDRIKSIIAEWYPVARRSRGGTNKLPVIPDWHAVLAYQPDYLESAASVNDVIDRAIANNEWIVLVFHEIVTTNPAQYEYSRTEFDKIAKHVSEKKYPVITMAQGYDTWGSNTGNNGNPNLVKNGDFSEKSGSWVTGWSRSSTQNITLNENGNGTAPTPATAINFEGTATKDIIRADKILVNGSTSYIFEVYLKLINFITGGQAVWVNEYNAQGTLISGKWLFGTYTNFTGKKSLIYTPTSPSVASIQIAIYTDAGSNLDLYIDTVSLKEL